MPCGTIFTILPQINACQLNLEQASGNVTALNLHGATAKEVRDSEGVLQYILIKTLLEEVKVSAASDISIVEIRNAIANCHFAGIPPTITNQPDDQIVIELAEVTVSVTAINAGTYQWQERFDSMSPFVDIAGATEFEYTSGPTIAGVQYRCVVTGVGGTTTSEPAAIIVA